MLGSLSFILAACGAPAELDESLFPAPGQTGYGNPNGGLDAFGGASTSGAGGNSSLGGASSAPPPPGGSMGVAQGGSAPLVTGGSMNLGGTGSGGSPPVVTGGAGGEEPAAAGAGGEAPAAGGSGGSGGSDGSSGSCPDDITVLFARPGSEGGCEGGGCHNPGGTQPDLVSPNVADRLLGVAASAGCGSVPYIGAGGESLLADKIVGSPPSCGAAMPFLSPQALSAEDEQCILDWIAEVSGG